MILELLKKLTYVRKICFKKFDHVRRSSFFNSPSKMNISADSNLIKHIAQTDIEGMTTLKWGEHCVECAAPECYKTCDMFIENDQGKCRRFLHGIKPSKNHAEIRPQSSEIVFLPWSNLLADIQGSLSQYDGFLLQIYNPTTETVPILFYLKGKDKKIRFLTRKNAEQGFNQFYFGMKDINAYLQTEDIHSVFIAPDVSDKTLLYIMFSDFVRLKQGLIRALKVKCLALDLDETIWKGVLIEDGPSGVEVNQELISYLQRFKEKGVILSVISKNNFDQAMACLRQHQLENLFVFPQISWEPKSINLKRLANALGIDSGAIVLVDDSSFERAEVETNFNSVRTIHPDEVGNFYNSKEVQEMVITNDSAKRTEYYKTEEARQKALQDTGNKEEAFLRSLNAKIEILNVTDKNITRAHELVQRTNRLNFTNHRYTQEEINNFLETKDRFVCRLISVKDRFGDYGVVGFFILEKTNEKEWFIKDLMFSCRIQGRHIDIFVLQKILENAQRHNIKKVKGILSLSTKNANAKEVYLSANFRQTQEEGGILSFEFNFEHQQVLTNDYITTVGGSNF